MLACATVSTHLDCTLFVLHRSLFVRDRMLWRRSSALQCHGQVLVNRLCYSMCHRHPGILYNPPGSRRQHGSVDMSGGQRMLWWSHFDNVRRRHYIFAAWGINVLRCKKRALFHPNKWRRGQHGRSCLHAWVPMCCWTTASVHEWRQLH